ncbi:YlbF family regulator [Virgibacillus sp. L01]|uniref:YlbF family regulator n=1 Tax=Virgibacillus sp. L01 TaxID=3457429 RepID=UPI003FD44EC5
MPNIYDSAYDLEKSIRESDEFKSLKEAYDAVMSDESAKQMFDNFRNTQMELQEKQMQGQEISEEEVEQARKVVETVQQHEDISKLMEQEQRLNLVINEVSQIITKPLEELYGTSEEESNESNQ